MNTEPLPPAPMLNFDKLVHVLLFFGLCGVIFFDSTNYLRFAISKIRIFLSIFLFPLVIGGLIEIIQEYFTPTRSGDWFDFLFDAIGVFLGSGTVLLINRCFLMKKKAI